LCLTSCATASRCICPIHHRSRYPKGERLKKRILVADDDRALVQLLNTVLLEAGYDVKTVFDGSAALRAITEYRPDLILLDVMMPVMDGYSICKNLAEFPQYSPAPKIIIMTSRSEERDKQIGQILGADAFVNKPFPANLVLAKIDSLLNQPGETDGENTRS
jgi:DNA-binding response OmpR family regulator